MVLAVAAVFSLLALLFALALARSAGQADHRMAQLLEERRQASLASSASCDQETPSKNRGEIGVAANGATDDVHSTDRRSDSNTHQEDQTQIQAVTGTSKETQETQI